MAKSNKFGTFGGVFTPSILTILGVIMFMRLPMIIGEAGLWATIGIVLIAHIISISTGLSVSSIATDKKVKAGGTYYIISRSLGLPIGGTLGLALFVGLSFSVSLYLIGFAESFLSFWGFPVTIDNIRLAGSIILLCVTIITFISTSLALKTQYLIMAAIILSLLSVFFGRHEFTPSEPHFFAKGSAVPLMVLFGIFFPAVTGFEAGVSMSGDLKDPKKSIPKGTIAAIAIGLLVYIGLIFFLSFTVQGDVLAKDPQVLLKISRVPQLVVAGIWGATLSSALGSILAAPRILQATAIDKITPKFFSKGSRAANEPRNALLLTFFIAEAGILVGDLNVIARIVSIFFITTYGFLNLSAAFEAATSADFRPSFRAPVWVSLVGALACFLVMIQLDFVALLGATLILGLLFLFLKRRQLSLEGGDAWSSVWASLVKTGIQRLNKSQVQGRNWRPNIIMFSGSESERPQLVHMGTSLAGTLGMITGFELEVTNETQTAMLQRRTTSKDNKHELVFYKHWCPDVYTGMDEIVRVFGFKGVEPNTAFMGWSNKKDRREQFENLIKIFDRNGISSIFLNYDSIREFGSYETIDFWWKGNDRNLAFAINIIRHFTSSGDWKDAKVRLLIAIDQQAILEKAHKSLIQIIDRYRVNMELKVINNSIDAYAWEDIVKKESAETDLTIIGIPRIMQGQFDKVSEEVDMLKQGMGPLLLINAGPQFEEIDIGIDDARKKEEKISDSLLALPDLSLTAYEGFNDDITKIDSNGQKVLEKLFSDAFIPCYSENRDLFTELKSLIGHIAEDLNQVFNYEDLHRRNRTIVRTQNDYYYHAKRILKKLLTEKLSVQMNAMEEGIKWYIDKLDQDLLQFPHHLTIDHATRDLKIEKTDNAALRWYKTRKRIFHPFARTTVPVRIRYKTAAGFYLKSGRYYFLHEFLNKYHGELEAVYAQLRPLLMSIDEQLELFERKINTKEIEKGEIKEFEKSFVDRISGIEAGITGLEDLNRNRLFVEFRKNLQAFIVDLERIDANSVVSKKRRNKKFDKSLVQQISLFAEKWHHESSNYINKIYLDVLMHSYKNLIKDKLNEFESGFNQELDTGLLKKLTEIKSKLDRIDKSEYGSDDLKLAIASADKYLTLVDAFEDITSEFRQFENEFPESITMADIPDMVNTQESNERGEEITLPLRKITGYVLETRFVGAVNDLLVKTMDSLKGSIYILNDLLSLTRFNLENIYSETENRSVIRGQIRDETLVRLSKEEKTIIDLKQSFIPTMSKILEETFDSLSSYKILESFDHYSRFSLDSQGKLVKSKFRLSFKYINKQIMQKSAGLLYSKSEGLLLAKQIITEDKPSVKNERILDIIENVTPYPEVMKALPHYYKNLFSGKSSISEDFWIHRPFEEAQFDKAIERFHSGVKGGIMLLGERNAGKSALCRYITGIHFKEDMVHHVFPMPGGSVQLEDFRAQLQKSTHLSNEVNEILDTLPNGSVIVIHDLELWWERSDQGMEIIDLILNLISRFSYKCLFIINMNSFAYELINRLLNMEHHFISLINCQVFNSEELKEMVMRRHRSSGLKLMLNKKVEGSISEITLARLFNRYFDYSGGNPGAALFQWLSNIEKVTTGTVHAKTPKSFDLHPIENLDVDSIVVLVQLALHKRMPYAKLQRILGTETPVTDEMVDSMIRMGMIEERPERLLLINPYIEPFIRKVFKRKGLV